MDNKLQRLPRADTLGLPLSMRTRKKGVRRAKGAKEHGGVLRNEKANLGEGGGAGVHMARSCGTSLH